MREAAGGATGWRSGARGATITRMPSASPDPTAPQGTHSLNRKFAIGLARAVGGAVIFSLPLYMTMEMWHLGFAMDRARLALFVALTYPFLVGLSHVSGFEPTFGLRDDLVDAAVAWAVGVVTGLCGLALLGVLGRAESASEVVGKIILQAIPGSIGALFAQSQFNDSDRDGDADENATGNAGNASDSNASDSEGRPDTYWSQLLVMAAGALFLAFNVAPTEEIILIAYVITPWHLLALVLTSLVGMHAFVYHVQLGGQESAAPGTPTWSVFVRYTVVGYALAALISAYVLWTFGRIDDTGARAALSTVLVLATPAAIGAAAARLLL